MLRTSSFVTTPPSMSETRDWSKLAGSASEASSSPSRFALTALRSGGIAPGFGPAMEGRYLQAVFQPGSSGTCVHTQVSEVAFGAVGS